jgi:hypothetical protein
LPLYRHLTAYKTINLHGLCAALTLTHVPAKWKPVCNGEPLFADKDMRQP